MFPLSSFCLRSAGLDSRNWIQLGISLVDPGDVALRRYCRCLPLPPLSPSAAVAAATSATSRLWSLHSLPPLMLTAASIDRRCFRRRHFPLLPSPTAAPSAAVVRSFCGPPLFPTAAAAAAAAVGRYRFRLGPLPQK